MFSSTTRTNVVHTTDYHSHDRRISATRSNGIQTTNASAAWTQLNSSRKRPHLSLHQSSLHIQVRQLSSEKERPASSTLITFFCIIVSSSRVFQAMATTRDLETKAGGSSVNMEDMFQEPNKEWRNPLVLFGAVATAGVVAAGLRSLQKVKSSKSQAMMLARVGLQAATVALMVGTVYHQTRLPTTNS